MKTIPAAHIALTLLACMTSVAVAQSSVDWQAVKRIKPSERIRVEGWTCTQCYFESATDGALTCFRDRRGLWEVALRPVSRVVFARSDVRAVELDRDDDSAGFRSLILAAGGGGGWDFSKAPTAFGGVKIGGPVTLNLGYDRLQGHSGFSTEGTLVLPLFRVPRFRRYVLPGAVQNANERFVRLYAEPGLGYRAGGGDFGGYTSAGMLLLLFPDDRTQPFVEVQRRFPFDGPLDGDTRISVGVMTSLCWHCGWE